MDDKEKLSLLQFAIGRFDHYYDSVNNKGNVYLTLNAALLAGIVTAYYALPDAAIKGWATHTAIIVALACNLLGTGFTLSALYPFLKKKSAGSAGSLFWFGDISCETSPQYAQRWAQLAEPKLMDDVLAQTHILACGLHKKFRKLKTATWFLMIELIFLALAGLLKIK